MSEHTQCRLTVSEIGTLETDAHNPECIASVSVPNRKANARRLVAAWNFAFKVPTEALEKCTLASVADGGALKLTLLNAHLDDAIVERDRLRTALQTIARGDYDNAHDPKAAARIAAAALEKTA